MNQHRIEKHLKISVKIIQVIKSPIRLIRPLTYYITKTGVLQSLRKSQDGNVRIGKESLNNSNFIYNDIMLPTQDPFVSRSHCMINYEEFFLNTLTDNYLVFLFGGHSRLGKNSILLNLPSNLFKYILDFVLDKNLPLLISPKNPIFMRLSNKSFFPVLKGTYLAIGTDILLQIDCADNEKCLIVVNRDVEQIFTLFHEEGKEYVIGRMEFAEIGVIDSKISRVQMRIKCKNGEWSIADGELEKMTVNGTWVMVGKYPEKISNGSELRISDCVLKIEW